MIIILFRVLILAAIIVLLYTGYQYWISPNRKLALAQKRKDFYFLDQNDDIKRNFFIAYKGYLFEGEKYVGATEDAFEVTNIVMHIHNPENLNRFERQDMYFLEQEILIRYAHAKIEWRYPMNRLLLP
ncbi:MULTISPECIES: sigma-w pathway protein ysdB [Gracilibacillus]|uniref:sigma-w pathway protein ysdB n=1 Tax=Gracilibacillus TaxID=74385 RepID=UPI000826106F|nr:MULTISPECIES: sigma-w pathway protein ysdB [Gracilibacillus]